MQTEHAIKLAGGTYKALADVLGITPGAIWQWKGTLPKARVWQLQSIRPEWFIADAPKLQDCAAVNVTTTAG